MDAYKKFTSKLEIIMIVVATTLFMIFFGALILQVVFRFILRKPLTWTEELAKLLNVWIVLFGTSIAVKANTHIRVELLDNVVNSLNKGSKKIFDIVTKIVCPLILIIVFLKGSYIMMLGEWSIRFTTLPLPQGILYMPLLISSVAMILFLIENLLDILTKEATN